MNKYQEAIDYFTIGRIFTEEEVEDMYEMRYRLAELIDKVPYWLELEERDKSIKPTHKDIGHWKNVPHCKKCDEMLLINLNYCGICGQKIDWRQSDGK